LFDYLKSRTGSFPRKRLAKVIVLAALILFIDVLILTAVVMLIVNILFPLSTNIFYRIGITLLLVLAIPKLIAYSLGNPVVRKAWQ